MLRHYKQSNRRIYIMAKEFVPTVWSTRTKKHLDEALVFGNIVNTEYEGDIKNVGDTVKIGQVGAVTISDYTAGSLAAPEALTATTVSLVVDKAKAFNFSVDDIESHQSIINMVDAGVQRAAYGLALAVDTDIAAEVENAGIKVDSSATPAQLTVANMYDSIVDLAVKLDEANVSPVNRFLVLPSAAFGLLAKDARFTRSDSTLANGFEGKVAGFDLYKSNNVKKAGTKFSVLGGSTDAIAYVGQISKMEQYRPEGGFSDAVKGLCVYGIKTIQPNALVKWVVEFPAA